MADVKRKSKPIMKGMKLPVTIEDSINDVLVVCLNIGTKCFRGVLMDVQKRNEPHGISTKESPQKSNDSGVQISKPGNKIVTRKQSSDKLTKSPAKENSANERQANLSSLPLRHSYNQDLSLLDEQYAVFARKPANFRFGAKVRNIRLRPRQTFCAKCKMTCIEDKGKANSQASADKMLTRSAAGNANSNANNSSTMTTRFSLRRQKMLNEEKAGGKNKKGEEDESQKVNAATSKANELPKTSMTISTQTDTGDVSFVSLTNEIMGMTSNLRVSLGSNIPKVSPVIKISIGEQKVMEIPSRVHKENMQSEVEDETSKVEEKEMNDGYKENVYTKMDQASPDIEDKESDAESYNSYKKRRKLMKKAAKDKDKQKVSDLSDENGKRKHKRKRKHKHWNNEDKKMRYVKYNVKEFSLATDQNTCDETNVKVEKEDEVENACDVPASDIVTGNERPRLLYTWRPNNGLPSLELKEESGVAGGKQEVDEVEEKFSVMTQDVKPITMKQEPVENAFHLFTPERSDNTKQINDMTEASNPVEKITSPLKLEGIKVELKENLNPSSHLIDLTMDADFDEMKRSPLDSPLRCLEQFNKLSADVGKIIGGDTKPSLSTVLLHDSSSASIMSPITFTTPPHDDALNSKIDVIWNEHNESVRQASVIRSVEKINATSSSNYFRVSDVWNASPVHPATRHKVPSPDIFKVSPEVHEPLKESSTPDIWSTPLSVSPNNSSASYKQSTPEQDFLLSLKSPNDSHESPMPFKQHSSPMKSAGDLWKSTVPCDVASPLYSDAPSLYKPLSNPPNLISSLVEKTHCVTSTLHSPNISPFMSHSSISDTLVQSTPSPDTTSLSILHKHVASSIWKPTISHSVLPLCSVSDTKHTSIDLTTSSKLLYPLSGDPRPIVNSDPRPLSMNSDPRPLSMNSDPRPLSMNSDPRPLSMNSDPRPLLNSIPISKPPPLHPQISPVSMKAHHATSVIKSAPILSTRCTMTVSTRTTPAADARAIFSVDRQPAAPKEPHMMNYIESRPMFNIFTPRNSGYKPPMSRAWSRDPREADYQTLAERSKAIASQLWQSEHAAPKLNTYGLPHSETWPQSSIGGLANSKLLEQLSPNFVPDIWKQHAVANKANVDQLSPVEKALSYEPRVVMNPEYSDVSDSDDANESFSQMSPPHKVSPYPDINQTRVANDPVLPQPTYLHAQHVNSKMSNETSALKHIKTVSSQHSPSFITHNLSNMNAEYLNSNFGVNNSIGTVNSERLFPAGSHVTDKPPNHLNVTNHFNQSSEFIDKSSSSILPVVHNHSVAKCVTSQGRKITQNDVVWGKVQGSSWWPARVLSLAVTRSDQGAVLSQAAHLSWFGSASLSYNKCDELSPFLDDFHIRYNKKKKGVYRMAVKQATMACQNDIKMYHNINLEELEAS